MASNCGFETLSKAIPKDLAEKAANALLQQRKHSREKYDAYELPPICYEIRDKYNQNGDKTALIKLFHPHLVPPVPDHVFAGVFHETQADPDKWKTAERGEIYVTIALTDLSRNNGWYIFFEGSRVNHPVDKTKKAEVRLEAGDAVIWRGDLVYFHSPGGGGMFETLTYKVDNVS